MNQNGEQERYLARDTGLYYLIIKLFNKAAKYYIYGEFGFIQQYLYLRIIFAAYLTYFGENIMPKLADRL